ncbi:MAG: DUF4878 domain-containing protein, partial [Actinomycetota bacterium]|nr:DUF4878 domain-containing protein [Actinomycetota bacterium]
GTDTEPDDAEPADAESADAESEPAESEPAESEQAESGTSEAELVESEQVEAERVESADQHDTPAAAEQTEPSRPKPKGGRGIDSATAVIRREDLPEIADLEDLDSISAVDDDETTDESTDEGDAPVERRKPGGGIGPTDSATTVIRRDDLPDDDELEALESIETVADEPSPADDDTENSADDAEPTGSDEAEPTDDSIDDPTDEWTDVDEAVATGVESDGVESEGGESEGGESEGGDTPPGDTDDVDSDHTDDDDEQSDATADDDADSGTTKALPAAAAAGAAAAGAATAKTSAAQGWSTAAHKPEVIPPTSPSDRASGATTSATEKSRGTSGEKKRGSRRWWIAAAAVVVVLAVAGAVFGFLNLRPPAPADEAADTAEEFSTALYEGDLATLRSITCGERQQFYASISDADFQKIYDGQRARDELVRIDEIKAVKLTGDGEQAVVEVSAVQSANPDQPQTVTINLQKSGEEWKVCTPQ